MEGVHPEARKETANVERVELGRVLLLLRLLVLLDGSGRRDDSTSDDVLVGGGLCDLASVLEFFVSGQVILVRVFFVYGSSCRVPSFIRCVTVLWDERLIGLEVEVSP